MNTSRVVAGTKISGGFQLGNAGRLILIFLAILFSCLLGIWTRPLGLLATFWPANAVALGIFLRVPEARRLAGWTTALCAFLIADLVTGAGVEKALVLNLANMASIAGAYSAMARRSPDILAMRVPKSISALLVGSAVGGIAGGVCGMIANPLLFGGKISNGFQFWGATELVNYLTVLPLVLSVRSNVRDLFQPLRLSLQGVWPFATLCLSWLASLAIGGPGSIAFTLPALVWCGLSYSIFVTALLTAGSGYLALSDLVTAYVPLAAQSSDSLAIASYRLGVSLISLVPIMLAITSVNRRQALRALNHIATRDPLTNIENRRAFLDNADAIMTRSSSPAAVIMLDIDHFKRINDTFGHGNGDQVLVEFAARVRRCLRRSDLMGRLGGEEFAVLLPNCGRRRGVMIAERIREEACKFLVKLDDGRSIRMTVSTGVALRDDESDIRSLLAMADVALYSAKRDGRNRVQLFDKSAPCSQVFAIAPIQKGK